MTAQTENPADLTATELLHRYRDGSLSPVEVVESVLARVEELEPTLRATYALDPAAARADAAASERRWHCGTPLGTLDGVPVTVKENIATAGTPVPLGTAATALVPAERDAPAADRLRHSGAVIFTKTTMPEYGMLSSGVSSFHPLTRNPWDPTRTAGGSSAGAAAAAAAGYGPLHLGTDIGGSIRLPAGWCGVVGLKPTHGRVPVDPPYPGRVVGPITRTVADAALLLSVVSGLDPRDHTSVPDSGGAFRPRGDAEGLRIGLLTDAGVGLAITSEVARAVTEAGKLLESAGAIVEPAAPIVTRRMLDGLDRFWRARSAADVDALPADRRAMVLPQILEWADGARGLTGAEVFDGFSQMGRMAAAVVARLLGYDYLLSPVAPITAFAAELAYPTDGPRRPFEHIGFTVPYNMSGHPAVSVNCGWSGSGLPIGLQIAGARFDDLGVLALAALVETLIPDHRPWPTS